MRGNLARRLDRLERAQPRTGAYRLAWSDEGALVPLRSENPIIAMPGAPLYQRKVVYSRFASQRQFDELPVTFKGFSGPVGSGKSKALCHEVIKCCYLNPGVPGLLGAPTEQLLASSTLIELLSILELEDIPHVYRKSSGEIHLPEPDATILLRSLDNPERLRAMNLGWFGIDELTYCKEAAWLRLEGRIRHPLARYRRGFAVWTPKGKDWVWRRFISARKIESHLAVRAKPFENKVVLQAAPDYYRNLELSYDAKFYEQEVKGEYVDIHSGAVYHAFSEKNVEECSFDPALPLIVALDFNVNPMSGVLLQFDPRQRYGPVNVLEEIVLPGSHTAAWCQRFLEQTIDRARAVYRMQGAPLEVRFYGDATGGSRQAASGDSNWSIVRELIGAQSEYSSRMLYSKSNPAVVDRVNAVNALLCNAAETRRLRIHPSCQELISDFEEVLWKVDAHGNTYPEINKSNSRRTHTSDALGYYIATEHGLTNDKIRFSKTGF